MFLDFDDIFNDDKNAEIKTPKAVMDYLNSQLPKGLKYASDENGNCFIIPEENTQSLTLSGFKYILDENDKKVLGKNYEFDDLLEYFYNAQKRVKIHLIKENVIICNGQELSMDKFIRNPLQPFKLENGEFFMFPQRFPPPFSLKIGDGKYERILTVKRVPNNSVDVAVFESDKNEPLSIKYTLREKMPNMTFNISYNLQNVKNVRDIVESLMIYNAFCENRGYFCGEILPIGKVNKKDETILKDSAIFWEKVLQVETLLGKTFTPPKEDIAFDTMCTVEFLYQCLINKNPIRDTQIISSINGAWEMKDNQEISPSDKGIYFEFQATITVQLMGEEFSLPALMGVFDSKIERIEENEKTQKLILANISDEKPRYTSILLFKSETDLKDYLSLDRNAHLTAFHDAKRAREYLVET